MTEKKKEDEGREWYLLTVKFTAPSRAVVPVTATSKEQADTLAKEQFKDFADFEIVDNIRLLDNPEIMKQMQTEQKI